MDVKHPFLKATVAFFQHAHLLGAGHVHRTTGEHTHIEVARGLGCLGVSIVQTSTGLGHFQGPQYTVNGALRCEVGHGAAKHWKGCVQTGLSLFGSAFRLPLPTPRLLCEVGGGSSLAGKACAQRRCRTALSPVWWLS